MTFEEHLNRHRTADGEYDLAAAEKARADELRSMPEALDDLADKAANAERRRWESSNRDHLRKQFLAGQGSFADMDARVPLGDSVVVRLGDMNHDRIRIRKDLRTRTHLDENRAYDAEMTYWLDRERRLGPGETLDDLDGDV